MGSKTIRYSGGFCVLLALMLLLVPLPWMFAGCFAALVHEVCHYLAIRACTHRRTCVKIFSYAARMPLPEMSRGREVLCALAGPVGALGLLLLARWMPRVAVCSALQSAYNLLPIYPLDGGRALRSGAAVLLSPHLAKTFCRLVEVICKFSIVTVAIYGCFWLHLGIFPLLLAGLLLIRAK